MVVEAISEVNPSLVILPVEDGIFELDGSIVISMVVEAVSEVDPSLVWTVLDDTVVIPLVDDGIDEVDVSLAMSVDELESSMIVDIIIDVTSFVV